MSKPNILLIVLFLPFCFIFNFLEGNHSVLDCSWCWLTWSFLGTLQGAVLQLEVEGTGFLYRQVRNMVILLSYLNACFKFSLLPLYIAMQLLFNLFIFSKAPLLVLWKNVRNKFVEPINRDPIDLFLFLHLIIKINIINHFIYLHYYSFWMLVETNQMHPTVHHISIYCILVNVNLDYTATLAFIFIWFCHILSLIVLYDLNACLVPLKDQDGKSSCSKICDIFFLASVTCMDLMVGVADLQLQFTALPHLSSVTW